MHGPIVDKIYLQPLGFLRGCTASRAVKAGQARWLAGGGAADGSGLAYAMVRIIFRQGAARHREEIYPVYRLDDYLSGLSVAEQEEAAALLEHIDAPRPALAGPGAGEKSLKNLSWSKPLIQGIVNVTPDSFSDGGRFDRLEAAVAHARALIEAGADIIDIGGESTRPGAAKVSIEVELERVIPVIERLKDCATPISIDSRNAAVMRAALKAGAHIINDVSALTHDEESLACAAEAACPVILMHARHTPDRMQDDPRYDDVLLDVYDYLADRVRSCEAAGIAHHRLIIDPGIGFGKTVDHNIELLANLSLFHGLGAPILLGVSRKSFIGHITGEQQAEARLAGSLAAGQAGCDQGVQILRVHDVDECRQARDIWAALRG